MADTWESYLSSIDWTEKIINQGMEQNSKKWLLTEVAEYISDEYNIPNTSPNNMAVRKAKELMDGVTPNNEQLKNHSPIVAGKSERERKLIFKKIVAEAQQNGYLEKFRLQEPWHPLLFMEEEINTYPYQHNSMITFRGVSRDHFYLGGDDPTGKGRNASQRHPDSVLNLGHWNPGNSWNEDNEDAVWTTFKRTAQGYADRLKDGKKGVLLKMQVPTQWVQCGAHKTRVVNNLEEMQREFGSPEAYREHINNHRDENCAWLIRPQVPLEYIIKVWDLELFDYTEPGYALPLQSEGRIDAIDLMHFFQQKKLPDEPEFGDAENHEENHQVMAVKNLVKDTVELKRFCESLLRDLSRIEGKKYNLKLIRKVVVEEENINQLIKDLVDSTQDLNTKGELNRQEVNQIEQLEEEIGHIRDLSEKVEELSENEIKNLISENQVSNEFKSLINKFYLVQVSHPETIEKMEFLETKNQELQQVTHKLLENFRYLKMGATAKRGGEWQTYPIRNFDESTREISEDVGGPNEGLNEAVEKLLEASTGVGLNIQREKKKIHNLDQLQEALARTLRITKIIDERIEENLEDAFTNGKIPEEVKESLENLYMIEIADDFEENVTDSEEKIANELSSLKREIKTGIKLVNWFHKIEVRFAEIVKISESAIKRSQITERQVSDLGDAIYSYETDHGDRYGTKHMIKRARQKLDISKDLKDNEKETMKDLKQGAEKRIKFIEKRKPKIEQVEKEFKAMIKEIEKLRSNYKKIPKDKLENELKQMETEFQSQMNKGGSLHDFYQDISNLEWNYRKFREKAQQRKQKAA